MARCFDCFAEFDDRQDRFAVLKQMRDFGTGLVDPEEARILNGLLFDPVFVCNACAGWYGADAIQVTADEAS